MTTVTAPPPRSRRPASARAAGDGRVGRLIPCPSALVVLLGAVAQHQIGLGMVLIVAFSAGLAATLTGLGLLVVAAGRLSTRLSGARASRVLTVLPALSAVAIVAVGLALTAQAVPKVLSNYLRLRPRCSCEDPALRSPPGKHRDRFTPDSGRPRRTRPPPPQPPCGARPARLERAPRAAGGALRRRPSAERGGACRRRRRRLGLPQPRGARGRRPRAPRPPRPRPGPLPPGRPGARVRRLRVLRRGARRRARESSTTCARRCSTRSAIAPASPTSRSPASVRRAPRRTADRPARPPTSAREAPIRSSGDPLLQVVRNSTQNAPRGWGARPGGELS